MNKSKRVAWHKHLKKAKKTAEKRHALAQTQAQGQRPAAARR
ncbi:MAG: hypothetical protein ABI068_17360 [Ktedonobacterales bacterium]